MCVYMYHACSSLTRSSLGGRRPTRAPRPRPPERQAPGARSSSPLPAFTRHGRQWTCSLAPAHCRHHPEARAGVPGTEPGIHGHQVLAPAASFIVFVANNNRDCVASSSTIVSSSVVTASFRASSSTVSSSTVVTAFCASRVHVDHSLV
jgi:hypothetical protein